MNHATLRPAELTHLLVCAAVVAALIVGTYAQMMAAMVTP